MAKKILVVGGGGREHAIIKALKKSPDCGEVWCAPGNGGIGYDAHCVNIKATDVETVSYTHLDVYKRQILYLDGGRKSR